MFKQDGSRGHHMSDFIPAEDLAKLLAKGGDAMAQVRGRGGLRGRAAASSGGWRPLRASEACISEISPALSCRPLPLRWRSRITLLPFLAGCCHCPGEAEPDPGGQHRAQAVVQDGVEGGRGHRRQQVGMGRGGGVWKEGIGASKCVRIGGGKGGKEGECIGASKCVYEPGATSC